MNKRFFTLFRGLAAALLCAVATTAHAQATPQLIVWLNDGTSTEVNLLTKPVVKVDGSDMVISSTEVLLRYAVADIDRFTFNEDAQKTYTGISSPCADPGCQFDGDRLVVHGCLSPSRVSLFTQGGRQVPATVTKVGDDIILSLSSIPSGVYLLNVNGKTIKITKP